MNTFSKAIGFFVLLAILLGGTTYVFRDAIMSLIFKPTSSSIPTKTIAIPGANDAQNLEETTSSTPETVAENLEVPWEIVFLPDGSYLITQRSGSLVRVTQDSKNTIPVSGVVHRGEGGLMGMALHPNFTENQWLYLYLTTQAAGGLVNRVERYRFIAATNQITDRVVILENIPGAANHDGGRIAFGPDGFLYITTGDAQNSADAQDTQSLAGKILRIAADGSIPADNPFGNAVYSYGHRNPQGIAWDSQGRLWSSEHGPSGTGSGFDEVNLIEKGGNYGWPDIQGTETASGMRGPVIQSGATETWAPSGLAIAEDTLFFTGLRGESLYGGSITGTSLENLAAHFREEYGRLRIVQTGPDGWIYFGTSNTDGRGSPRAADDTILRIKLDALQ